jgi:hypothetical protein
MLKGKHVVLTVWTAALLCWQFLPMNAEIASGGIIDPCSSDCWTNGTEALVVCPQNDGNTLAERNSIIYLVVKMPNGTGIGGIQASDIWVIGVGTGDLALIGGSGSSDADSATNDNGETTISGSIAAGGQDSLLAVCVQSVVIEECSAPAKKLPIKTRSPDIDGDGDVDLADFAIFGQAWANWYPPPPQDIYDWRCDYDGDGDIDLADFSIFGQHWDHSG